MVKHPQKALSTAAPPRLTLIAALSEEGALGRNGTLPWRCPEDLAFFQQYTLGKTLLMGRTTFEGLPTTLPGRNLLILTRDKQWHHHAAQRVSSFEEAYALAPKELLVAGGAQVYAQALPHASQLVLSRIPVSVPDADAYFPSLASDEWVLQEREQRETFAVEYWERPSA